MTDAIDEIIHTEGGFVHHKADKGGPTNLGITQRTLSYYLGRKASIEDVKNITKETARENLRKNVPYWPSYIHTPISYSKYDP